MILRARNRVVPIVIVLFLAVIPSLLVPKGAAATDIQVGSDLTQSEFKDLTRQAGLVISYNPLSPAEPLGIFGFDVGIEVAVVDIDQQKSYWKDAVDDSDVPSYIPLPKLHAQLGLPLGIDVGLVYSKVPIINLSVIGGEVKWAFLKGGMTWPAVAVRGSYTQLLGVNDLDLSTFGADLSISKGFAFITPYVGIGQVWIRSAEHTSLVDLDSESVTATKGFLGAKISIVLVNLVVEYDIAEIPTYNLRANISF